MSRLAEQHVIGSIFLDLNCISQIYDKLTPDMFGSDLFGAIYAEGLKAYTIGVDFNPVTVLQKLEGDNYPSKLILSEIAQCTSATVTSTDIGSYADVMIKDFKAKQLENIINRMKPVPDRIYEQINNILTEIESLKVSSSHKIKSIGQIIEENNNKYFTDSNTTQPIYTGFNNIDNTLGSLEGGDMIVIGARPAVGKSAFMAQIALNIAMTGKSVAVYNLEMSDKQEYERFLSSTSGISMTRIRRAKAFMGNERERFNNANSELSNLPLYLRSGTVTPDDIRREIKHLGIDLIIIDYLQLVRSDRKYGNRFSEVGDVSKSIKSIAMDLNIPIIALSQLNRVSELKENREPTMAELRETGDIEQDASIIMLMWNLSGDDASKKGLKIDKNRQGNTNKFVLQFRGDTMRFEETDQEITLSGQCVNDNKTPFDTE